MQRSNELPNLFLQNVETKRTPHSVFTKCGVQTNSPLWSYKMWKSHELPAVFLKNAEFKQTPRSALTKCGVQTNSPLCSYKMQSSNKLPTLLFQNAEIKWTLYSAFTKCGNQMNSPLCGKLLVQVYVLLVSIWSYSETYHSIGWVAVKSAGDSCCKMVVTSST